MWIIIGKYQPIFWYFYPFFGYNWISKLYKRPKFYLILDEENLSEKLSLVRHTQSTKVFREKLGRKNI